MWQTELPWWLRLFNLVSKRRPAHVGHVFTKGIVGNINALESAQLLCYKHLYFLMDLRLGGAAKLPIAPGVDLLVHVTFWHVLLVCAAVTVRVVHSVLLTVMLGGGYQ
ncbi:hypothetical protein COP2_009536 [Malus domestica]